MSSTGSREIPPYGEDVERRACARGGARAARGDPRRRRRPDRDPRVQPLDPRPAQERARLGLAPGRAERAERQAGAAIGASTGMFGAVWAQAELRKVLARWAAGWSRPSCPVAHAQELLEGDRLELAPSSQSSSTEILAELIGAAESEAERRLPRPKTPAGRRSDGCEVGGGGGIRGRGRPRGSRRPRVGVGALGGVDDGAGRVEEAAGGDQERPGHPHAAPQLGEGDGGDPAERHVDQRRDPFRMVDPDHLDRRRRRSRRSRRRGGSRRRAGRGGPAGRRACRCRR